VDEYYPAGTPTHRLHVSDLARDMMYASNYWPSPPAMVFSDVTTKSYACHTSSSRLGGERDGAVPNLSDEPEAMVQGRVKLMTEVIKREIIKMI